MVTRRKNSEAETLEQYRVALENAVAQPEIAATLAVLGFDAATIEEGKSILTETRKAYDFNTTENNETTEARANYMSKREALEDTYGLHRKKAKVIFRKDAVTYSKLELSGGLPRAYVKWLEVVRAFYTETSKSEVIQTKLARLKITKKDITAATKLITELEHSYSLYQKEMSEDQAATSAKDTAFAKIDDWMSEFYAVAKIGLEDNPQLLEALGKTIRN